MSEPARSSRYLKPPVVERVISAILPQEIDADRFEKLSVSWGEKVRRDFPHPLSRPNWKFNIEDKNGVPQFAGGGPTLEIQQWFLQKPEPLRGLVLQSLKDRFSINLLRDNGSSFSFEDIRPVFLKWLAIWAAHFEVGKFSGYTVDYVNDITPETVPGFSRDGALQLGEILTIFQTQPLKYLSLIPPYQSQLNFQIEKTLPIFGSVNLHNISNGIRLAMQMRSTKPGKKVSVDNAADEVDLLHSEMVICFDSIFTESAKATFQREQA